MSFADVTRWVERFEAPERAVWQRPAEVIAALNVQRGDRVADIGAGTGYFTLPLARAVGEEGVVYAVDDEPAMLAHLKRRAAHEHAPMINAVHASARDPRLPERVDLAFVANTYHHLADRRRWLARLRRGLGSDGRVAIVDWHKRRMPIGPEQAMKLSARTVIEDMRSVGLRLARKESFLPYQYFLIFTPTRS
jgi:ubiquinone/menaquinone biosynthesis C-methylase UbiE